MDADPLAGLKPPKLDSKVVPALSDQQLRALLAACQGPALCDRRDEALVRLLTETGLRAGETVALQVEDLDLRAGTVHVRRGKGGKGRLVPFGPQTARALDRYLRLRRQHRLADTPALWLGDRGRGFGYDAPICRPERPDRHARLAFLVAWLCANGLDQQEEEAS